jgi:glycosyltransferase involved in cell wall biosynthesis
MPPHHKLIRITTVPISLKVLLRRQLRFMSSYFDVIAVSSPGKTLEEVGEQEGVRTSGINMTRAITPLKDLKALWMLYRLFRKEKPAIVHTHTPKAGLIGMLAGRLAGVPIRLHTVAGLPLMEAAGKKRKLLETVEKITYQAATRVYPNSRNLSQFILANKFCSPEKITVLGNGSSNGIDTDFFKPDPGLEADAVKLKAHHNITGKNFVFVFIGRLVKDKGIEELIEAFTRLQKEHSHIRLLLVGPFEPELDPIAPETRMVIETNKSIIVVGFQQDVRPYYMISHVLTFPSYREGFPNVPMQAGCFGLPCIVTNINGCNEIIEPGINGIVIPVKNSEALRQAMQDLLTRENLYLQMQVHARKMIVERYEQKHLWALILQEYQDQLKQHVS